MIIADFTYLLRDWVEDPLEEAAISCSNITSGEISSTHWEWFIDGTSVGTSTEESIVIEYTTGIEYSIVLTVTVDSIDYTLTRVFLCLDGEQFIVFQSIIDLVKISLGNDVNWPSVHVLKSKYQSLLYDALMGQFANVAWAEGVTPTHDERFWPPLANLLISYLIIRDLSIENLNSSLAGGGGGNTPSGGEVTRILTGPTEVRFAPPSTTLSAAFADGFYQLIQNQLCALASRLGVLLKGCDTPTITPRVMDTGYTGYSTWMLVPPQPVSVA